MYASTSNQLNLKSTKRNKYNRNGRLGDNSEPCCPELTVMYINTLTGQKIIL